MLNFIQTSPALRQFLTIICCNLLTLSFGIANGWATINFLELQRQNSNFSMGSLSPDQLALVISITSIGSILGNFGIPTICAAVGVKSAIHLFGIPLILSSVLIIWAQNVYFLYASRLLSGFVFGGITVAIPILANNISFDNIRGALVSVFYPSYNIGLIISFILGNFLHCIDQAKVQLIVPVIFMGLMFLIPEAPEFWIQRNNQKQTEISQRFYKRNAVDSDTQSKDVQSGAFEIADQDKEREWNSKCGIREKAVFILKQFLKPQAKKAFFISFSSLVLSHFTSVWCLMHYATDIFSRTGSSFSEKSSSILLSIVTLCGTIIFIFIVDRINRKTLFTTSAVLTAIGYFWFGIYYLFWSKQEQFNWMPPICFSCILFFACMGLVSIPLIISVEILPKEIRPISLAVITSILYILGFVFNYVFPVFLNTFGFSKCMITLGCVCLFNALNGILFIPETRAKSHEEIMEALS